MTQTAAATASDGTPLAAIAAALHTLAADITAYAHELPPGDRYYPPIIDWHHPTEYGQAEIGGLSKFLNHVVKEKSIVDAFLNSPNPPADYSTNLIALQGAWDAFLRSPRPLVGIAQCMEKRVGPPGGAKVDVVCAGGNEWVKVNTIKESRLVVEFREQDSYLNSDYESDDDDAAPPVLTNSLLSQARALVNAAKTAPRLAGLPPPRIRYVLSRLERNPEGGHADPRIPQTLDTLESLGIQLEFPSTWGPICPAPPIRPEPLPVADIVVDLSVLIALCCDSTHQALPANDDELETRFRPLCVVDGAVTLAPHSNASRDLRDQLKCEMARPLMHELQERLAGLTPRFWVTQEVRDRLPSLVDVIGGDAERARAKALFEHSGDFWAGSRWQGKAGCLADIHIRILEEEDDAPPVQETRGAFDTAVMLVCRNLLAASDNPRPCRRPRGAMAPSRLPSGHTLRTLAAGIGRGATLLTNNRGAVLKVMREAGVTDGIAGEDETRARIWVVNPSSLSEWRRNEVEAENARVEQEKHKQH